MNLEFHYYSTAFLAVKAGFKLPDAKILAYSSQYVDHHHRTYEIRTSLGTVLSHPTQNYSFWDQATVARILGPFHFFPAGSGLPGVPLLSVRADGMVSPWDVRPNSGPVRRLLVEALRSRDLYRIGVALHTFSDTWAHQNFTARDEPWNRLDPANRLPSPGHLQAGWVPDQWEGVWTDPRLKEPQVVNSHRFSECARKVYRYLCTLLGKDFRQDEEEVAAGLRDLVDRGRGMDTPEDRALGYILALDLEPYDRTQWLAEALEPPEDSPTTWPIFDRWKKVGGDLLDRTGLAPPQRVQAKKGFEATHLAAWIRAAENHRNSALTIIADITGGTS